MCDNLSFLVLYIWLYYVGLLRSSGTFLYSPSKMCLSPVFQSIIPPQKNTHFGNKLPWCYSFFLGRTFAAYKHEISAQKAWFTVLLRLACTRPCHYQSYRKITIWHKHNLTHRATIQQLLILSKAVLHWELHLHIT